MQRIVCRYRRDVVVSMLGHNEVRQVLLDAVTASGLEIGEGRRMMAMSPPLPSGATSEAERVVLELLTPCAPGDVRRLLNLHLPDGVYIEGAWSALPGGDEDNPAALDEAIYDVTWSRVPLAVDIRTAVHDFLQAQDVLLTRRREKKTQVVNARALVYDVRVLTTRDGFARVFLTVSVGPQGSLRPDEFIQVLGEVPTPDAVRVHRVALQRSFWRHPSSPRGREGWRRTL